MGSERRQEITWLKLAVGITYSSRTGPGGRVVEVLVRNGFKWPCKVMAWGKAQVGQDNGAEEAVSTRSRRRNYTESWAPCHRRGHFSSYPSALRSGQEPSHVCSSWVLSLLDQEAAVLKDDEF